MSEQDEPPAGAPAPPFRGYAAPVFWFLAGLVIFGVAVVALFFLLGTIAPPDGPSWIMPAFAVVLLALTAGAGIFALRRGKVALGSGLLVGYAVATVFSAGQCTLWAANPDYAMLTGFFVYIMAIVGVLVVAFVTAIVDLVRRSQTPRGPA